MADGSEREHFREGDSGVLEAVARSGARLVVPVLRVVVDEEGDVWHVVEKPLAAGTEVTGRVRLSDVMCCYTWNVVSGGWPA